MAKDKEPSEKAVRKARKTKVLKRIVKDLEYFRILKAWTDFVVFRYAGRDIRFEYYEGRIVRIGGDTVYLSDDDYHEMFMLSKVVMTAVGEALKELRKKQAKKDKAVPKLVEPPTLFAGLPIMIDPKKEIKRKRK